MISTPVFARYAAMRVPRYTSYPTSPNFSEAVGEQQYAEWLAQLPPGAPVSVYLHIPFCRAMCWYCGCHTSVTRRAEPIERYAKALADEIDRVARALPERMALQHLHWGGGSPTLLTPEHFQLLHILLRSRFDLAHNAELAIEIDPRTLDEDFAAALGRAGINRASVGVQSFDPKVQRAINRIQTVDETATAVGLLRRNGVEAISFDLIHGLPHQTVGSCVTTVNQAIAMRPDRLAVFGYAHVPSFKAHQRKIDETALPGAAERLDQASAIADALKSAGYVQVGIDHFALPGDSLAIAAQAGGLHRNFQGYTTDRCDILLGFGSSAISKLPQGFIQNSVNISDYQQRIAADRMAVARGYALTEEDRERARIIEQLMCEYRAEATDLTAPGLKALERDGLIRLRGDTIEVNPEARPLVRAVAAAFDSYLPQTSARHLPAV